MQQGDLCSKGLVSAELGFQGASLMDNLALDFKLVRITKKWTAYSIVIDLLIESNSFLETHFCNAIST